MKHKIEMLKKAYEKYCESYEFEPGDIVRWKPLVRPEDYNCAGPFIVIRVIAPEEPGSPFEEKHLVLAMIKDNGRLDTFCPEACYFEPVDEEDYEDE